MRRRLSPLYADLRQLGAFATPWQGAETRTVGGGGQTVRLTLDDETIQIPRQLARDQRARRDAIVERILAAVPR